MSGLGVPLQIIQEDPSLKYGFRPIYDREIFLEVRIVDDKHKRDVHRNEIGHLQAIRLKILTLVKEKRSGELSLKAVRVELSDSQNLHWHYFHMVDTHTYQTLQGQQKLMVDFENYTNTLIDMATSCIEQPNTFLAVMYLKPSKGTARLDFVQNLEYKFIELLSLNFARMPEELIQNHVQFKFRLLEYQKKQLEGKLEEVLALIKLNNPALFARAKRQIIQRKNR